MRAYIHYKNRVIALRSEGKTYSEIINIIGVTIHFDTSLSKTILSVLHFAEGAQWKSHKGLLFGNSDPTIIQLYKFKGVCVIMGGSTAIQLELEMIPELILEKIRGPIAQW